MQKLRAKEDCRIRVGGVKVNLNKDDVIEVNDTEVNFYLVSGFVKIGDLVEGSRVVKTSNKETQAMLEELAEDKAENKKPKLVITDEPVDPALAKRQELLADQQSPFEKGEIIDEHGVLIGQLDNPNTVTVDEELQALRNKYNEVYGKSAPTNKYGQDVDWLRKKIKDALNAKQDGKDLDEAMNELDRGDEVDQEIVDADAHVDSEADEASNEEKTAETDTNEEAEGVEVLKE